MTLRVQMEHIKIKIHQKAAKLVYQTVMNAMYLRNASNAKQTIIYKIMKQNVRILVQMDTFLEPLNQKHA